MKVLKIGAEWCSGCLVMKPRWVEIEKEHDWLVTEYFDYDKDAEKIEAYGVESESLPVFVFLDKDGKEMLRKEGEVSKKELVRLILENKEK